MLVQALAHQRFQSCSGGTFGGGHDAVLGNVLFDRDAAFERVWHMALFFFLGGGGGG